MKTSRKNFLTPVRIVVAVVAISVGAGAVASTAQAQPKKQKTQRQKRERKNVPVSRDMESRNGLKIRGAELVSDGGHVLVRYTVVDANRAENSLKNRNRKARVENRRNNKRLEEVGEMRHGSMRAGQMGYKLFQNSGGAVKQGDAIDIDIDGVVLNNVPIE